MKERHWVPLQHPAQFVELQVLLGGAQVPFWQVWLEGQEVQALAPAPHCACDCEPRGTQVFPLQQPVQLEEVQVPPVGVQTPLWQVSPEGQAEQLAPPAPHSALDCCAVERQLLFASRQPLQDGSTHAPLEQVSEPVQVSQAPPPVPQVRLVDCAWHWLFTQQVEQFDGPQVTPASVGFGFPTGVQKPAAQISTPLQVRQVPPLAPHASACPPWRQVPSSSQQPLQEDGLQSFPVPQAGASETNSPTAMPGMTQRNDFMRCPSRVPAACRTARQARGCPPLSGGASVRTTGLACRPANR